MCFRSRKNLTLKFTGWVLQFWRPEQKCLRESNLDFLCWVACGIWLIFVQRWLLKQKYQAVNCGVLALSVYFALFITMQCIQSIWGLGSAGQLLVRGWFIGMKSVLGYSLDLWPTVGVSSWRHLLTLPAWMLGWVGGCFSHLRKLQFWACFKLIPF